MSLLKDRLSHDQEIEEVTPSPSQSTTASSGRRRGSLRNRMSEETEEVASPKKKKSSNRSLRSRMQSAEPLKDSGKEDDWFTQKAKNKPQRPQEQNWYEEMLSSNQVSQEPVKKEEEPAPVTPSYDLQDAFGFSDEDMEVVALKQQWEQEKEVRRHILLTRFINGFLIFGCIYMIFLIFGVSMTTFQYSDKGRVEPQILGIKDIREKKAFEVVKVEYEKCQMVYEKILILNYRMESAKEDEITKIAVEYQPLAKEIQTLYKNEQAVHMDPKYDPIKLIIINYFNAAQQYCEKMSTGYTQNNKDDIDSASALWSGGVNNQTGEPIVGLQDQFITLHQNVVSLGEGLPGVDMIKIKQWRPDTFIDEYINGKQK